MVGHILDLDCEGFCLDWLMLKISQIYYSQIATRDVLGSAGH